VLVKRVEQFTALLTVLTAEIVEPVNVENP